MKRVQDLLSRLTGQRQQQQKNNNNKQDQVSTQTRKMPDDKGKKDPLQIPSEKRKWVKEIKDILLASDDSSNGSTSGPSTSPEVNPDDNTCPICREEMEVRAYAHRCFHSFCKGCLEESVKVKQECPICRQGIDRIIYNIKSLDDYEEIKVRPTISHSYLPHPQGGWAFLDEVGLEWTPPPFVSHFNHFSGYQLPPPSATITSATATAPLAPFAPFSSGRYIATSIGSSSATATGSLSAQTAIGSLSAQTATGSLSAQTATGVSSNPWATLHYYGHSPATITIRPKFSGVQTAIRSASFTPAPRAGFHIRSGLGGFGNRAPAPGGAHSNLSWGTPDAPSGIIGYFSQGGSIVARKRIYMKNLWAKFDHSKDAMRAATSSHFRDNQPDLMRFLTFVHRDCRVICLDNSVEARDMFLAIRAKIKQCDILSPEFRNIIEPYTGGNTDHFLHETYCFAVSQHNTSAAYDSAAQYVKMEETQVQTTKQLLQPVPNNLIPTPPSPMSPPDIVILDDSDQDDSGVLEVDDPPTDNFNNSETVIGINNVPSSSGIKRKNPEDVEKKEAITEKKKSATCIDLCDSDDN